MAVVDTYLEALEPERRAVLERILALIWASSVAGKVWSSLTRGWSGRVDWSNIRGPAAGEATVPL